MIINWNQFGRNQAASLAQVWACRLLTAARHWNMVSKITAIWRCNNVVFLHPFSTEAMQREAWNGSLTLKDHIVFSDPYIFSPRNVQLLLGAPSDCIGEATTTKADPRAPNPPAPNDACLHGRLVSFQKWTWLLTSRCSASARYLYQHIFSRREIAGVHIEKLVLFCIQVEV